GNIYAFGGEWFGDGGGVYSEVFEYDPREDKWRAVAAMPRPRHGLGAVAMEDGVYVLGGAARAGGNETSAVLDRFAI
ncbi:MAG: kelch repeat-containing protein, partial [Pseudomonadota bacterium]